MLAGLKAKATEAATKVDPQQVLQLVKDGLGKLDTKAASSTDKKDVANYETAKPAVTEYYDLVKTAVEKKDFSGVLAKKDDLLKVIKGATGDKPKEGSLSSDVGGLADKLSGLVQGSDLLGKLKK